MSTAFPTCPVCQKLHCNKWSDAKDYEYFSSDKNYTYYSCNDCDCIFIHPIPIDELNFIYPANYYSFANQQKNITFRIKEWLDKRFFKSILKKQKAVTLSILDVGGGSGWMLDTLKKADKRIYYTQIIDIDEHAKAIAEQNGHIYFKGTIEDFYTTQRFNIILLLNLIEHVANPLTVLQKAADLLQPDGVIVIKTPNTISMDARIFKKSYWGGLHCPRHWIIFSEKSFQLLTGQTSLQIRKLQYTQGSPFWAFSIIAYLHRKNIVTINADKPIIFHWLFAPLSAVFAIFDFSRIIFTKTSQMFILLEKKLLNS